MSLFDVIGANHSNKMMRQEFDKKIAGAQAEISDLAARTNAQTQQLAQASQSLAIEITNRQGKLKDLQEKTTHLLEVSRKQDEDIQELTAITEGLQSGLQKSQAQFQQLSALLHQTTEAASGTTTVIEDMKNNLQLAKAREAETQKNCETLEQKMEGVLTALDTSTNERIKIFTELKEQNMMLKQLLSHIVSE